MQQPATINSFSYRRLIKRLFLLLLGLLTVAIIVLSIAIFSFYSDLPSCTTGNTFLPAILQNKEEQLIALPMGGFVKIFAADKMNESVFVALVVAEDPRFLSHQYPDWRKSIENLNHIKEYHAHEIPERTARLILEFDHPEYSIEGVTTRNFREIILADRIEQCLSKQDILWLYANLVYLGHGRYGFGAASEFYFGKSAEDLSLGEAALLAGIIPAPDKYSPVRDFNAAKQRQRIVILKMVVEMHLITSQEGEEALNQPIVIKTPD